MVREKCIYFKKGW